MITGDTYILYSLRNLRKLFNLNAFCTIQAPSLALRGRVGVGERVKENTYG